MIVTLLCTSCPVFPPNMLLGVPPTCYLVTLDLVSLQAEAPESTQVFRPIL